MGQGRESADKRDNLLNQDGVPENRRQYVERGLTIPAEAKSF